MTLEELQLIRRHLVYLHSDNDMSLEMAVELVKESVKIFSIIDREIYLKTMDPRKDKS